MKEEDYSKAIEVFSGSPWEAEIIKGLLESNNIRCVIKDGIMGTLAPYIAPSVSVLVTEDDRGRIRSSHRANQKSGRER